MAEIVASIGCQASVYAFSRDNPPVKRVRSGDRVVLETYDCFQNQIQSGDTVFTAVDWDRVNPATGPVYVEGAAAGDVLAVRIDGIELSDRGVMVVGPGLGVMGHRIRDFEVKVIPIRDGKALFDEKLAIPLNPMIGVIGVAPAGEPVSCGTPGPHGGNIDNKMITTGATVYFPVFAEGALFALGDLHAAMGDGEIGVTGVEVAGKVTVTLTVIKRPQPLRNPVLESEEGLVTIVAARSLDEAVKGAVEDMMDLLLPYANLPLSQLTMLMSAAGQTQICQVVDPLLTARFLVPRWILDAYNIRLFQ